MTLSYHVATQEDYDGLMQKLEEHGVVWRGSRENPTKANFWENYKEETYILVQNKLCSWGKIGYFHTDTFSAETLIKYKVGDDIMQFTKDNVIRMVTNHLPKGKSSDRLRDEIEALKEVPEKVVIPRFVADWVERKRKQMVDFHFESGARFMMIIGDDLHNMRYGSIPKEVSDWIFEGRNDTTLCRAIDYGYIIEEEPLYRVAIPTTRWNEASAELETKFTYLARDITSDEVRIVSTNRDHGDWKVLLLEREIKLIDERFWAFATLVGETK